MFCALLSGASHAFAQAALRINEVLTGNLSYVSGDGSLTDWIELVNTSSSPLDIAGATLTDDDLDPFKWTIPDGVTIPPNGLLVVLCDAERPASVFNEPFLNTGFNLKSTGGELLLYENNFGPLLDSVKYGQQVADLSIGRIGTLWKLCTPSPNAANTAKTLGSASALKVNEWFANGSSSDDWFEIFNTGAAPVSLEGLYFTDVADPTTSADRFKSPVPPLTFIGTGLQAYLKFVADGNTNKGPDHVNFSLKAGGEAVAIFDGLGAKLESVSFGPQGIDISEGRLPDGAGLASVTTFAGTASPGRANYKAITSIIVSELLSHTDPPLEDAVEFQNVTDAEVDIGGWFLSNQESNLKKFRVPFGTKIPPHGFKVFYEYEFDPNDLGFTFNSAHGDQVYLAQANADGTLTGFRVGEEFEAAEHGVSFGRVETTIPNDHKFVAMASTTFGADNATTLEDFRKGAGAANSGPRIGPIIINEVHYNPLSTDGTDNLIDQFVELHNVSLTSVLLYDPAHPENRWRLQNGISYTFPPSRSIPAGGYALIVAFNPFTDLTTAANFKARWRVPAGVNLYGPFLGDLNNDGDSLELYKPDPPQLPPRPDAGFVPYIRVDKVNYTDVAPWSPEADGFGRSLQRKNPLVFGNDPGNWDAADPTAGVANSAELRDTDGDRMTDVWEDAHGFNKNDPSDAPVDTDADGFTNLQEFFAGTNPRSKASRLEITSIVPAKSDLIPLTITFTAAANKTYSVIYRNSLAISSAWQKLKDVSAEPTERVVTIEDTGAFARSDRYYRIVTPSVD